MNIKLLHLSDLHFRSDNMAQDIVTLSLVKKIEQLCEESGKPNIFIITGDIAYSGKPEEYTKAKMFIDKICKICDLNIQSVFLIPGNHDVDRNKIKPVYKTWWYNFKDENELLDILSEPQSFDSIIQTTSAYYDFIKSYMTGKVEIGKYGEYVAEFKTPDGYPNLKILGLNSSLFCGYDGDDKEKLALGLPQVASCCDRINKRSEIVITLIHHPFESFHKCEKPTIAFLKSNSDIILTGHVHEAQGLAQFGTFGETITLTAGASFEKRNYQNGFHILDIDLSENKGKVEFYKYKHDQHSWIKDLDNFQNNNGLFTFPIQPKSVIPEQLESLNNPVDLSSIYKVTLEGSLTDLSRENFELVESELKRLFQDKGLKIISIEAGSIILFVKTISQIDLESLAEIKKIYDFKLIRILLLPKEQKTVIKNSVFHFNAKLKDEHVEYISSPGASFSHPRARYDIQLNDIYVVPNLKSVKLSEEFSERVDKVYNADEVFSSKYTNNFKYVIYGLDSAGKTTLCKWVYNKFYNKGCIPILLDGSIIKEISSEKIMRIVEKEFHKQYISDTIYDIREYDFEKIILIIDNFHKIRFSKPKFKITLISNLLKLFPNILITGNDIMRYETFTSKSGATQNILEEFNRLLLIEFGPKLRYELIKKWNFLGSDFSDKNDLIRLNNDAESHIESIIGKSFVPSYPIFLLSILQGRELASSQKPEYSVHGFYYELLINDALNKSVAIKADISLYYNYITEYCYFLFEEKIGLNPLFKDDFLIFHDNYCKEYDVNISPKLILDVLVQSKILKDEDDTVAITYKYVYYFFVARYLANNISLNEIRNIVSQLCERVYQDEFASIVMFLTHLSKDQFVISELLRVSKSLFEDVPLLNLSHDVEFINELVNKLPVSVYKPLSVEEIKREALQEEEEIYQQEKEFNTKIDTYDYDLNSDITSLDILSKLIKSFKTIDLLGQVTKKYWGELKANQKYELVDEVYSLGLRSLGYYFSMLSNDTDVLVEYLQHIYRKKNINKQISKDEIARESHRFLFSICELATFGIVKRISDSVGYEKLTTTYNEVLSSNPVNSIKLIDLSIKLDHYRNFPWDDMREMKTLFSSNYLAMSVMKRLGLNYLYVFVTTEKEKQRLCDLIDVKMDPQKFLNIASKVKNFEDV